MAFLRGVDTPMHIKKVYDYDESVLFIVLGVYISTSFDVGIFKGALSSLRLFLAPESPFFVLKILTFLVFLKTGLIVQSL